MMNLGWAMVGIALISLVFLLFTGKSFGKCALVIIGNFVLGFGSLFAVNAASAVSGFTIPVNLLTLAGSGFLGLPGTMLSGALQVLASF